MIEKLLEQFNIYSKECPSMRTGQLLMNSLFVVNPDIYHAITGTKADCFYEDENIDNFWRAIVEYENNNSR